jgi:hypothetical protein
MIQLTRSIEVLKTFPLQFKVGAATCTLATFPRLMLALEVTPNEEQGYGVRHEYDVYCELQLKLNSAVTPFTATVILSTSRQWPPGEAVITAGNKEAAGLDLDALDDLICSKLKRDQVWERNREPIEALIRRWVTEYSMRSLSNKTDFDVANLLRTKAPDFYKEILTYVAAIDVVSPEIISSHIRTALVSPDVVRETMRKNPAPENARLQDQGELMNQTVEMDPTGRIKSRQTRKDFMDREFERIRA